MGIRTPDLLNAIEALYQLSYDPEAKENKNTGDVGWQCHSLIGGALPHFPSTIRNSLSAQSEVIGRPEHPPHLQVLRNG